LVFIGNIFSVSLMWNTERDHVERWWL